MKLIVYPATLQNFVFRSSLVEFWGSLMSSANKGNLTFIYSLDPDFNVITSEFSPHRMIWA